MYKQIGNLEFFQFKILSGFDNIIHFVTTRQGGLSEPPYDFLNFGLNSGDNPLKVIRNRDIIAGAFGFSSENFTTVRQIHGKKVRVITLDSIHKEKSEKKPPDLAADALITNLPNFCITVAVADCVPIILYDPAKKVIGVVHSGWQGTVKKIAESAIKTMIERFNCESSNIVAGIGPSIGPCCYEVGDKVIKKVRKAFDCHNDLLINEENSELIHLDLWKANHEILLSSGLKNENIEVSSQCTKCNPDRFFSYRVQGERYGRMAASIMLI
ncbi:MAG: peptidoglycan editing factor PgeF [Candidatus Zixiibacteriota bacterium]